MKEDIEQTIESVEQDVDVDSVTETTAVDGKIPPRKLIGTATKALVALILLLGLSTAVIAQTAPQLLAPIANSIPDSFFPQPEMKGKMFGSPGGC